MKRDALDKISEETRAEEKGKMRTFVVPRYNNVSGEFFVVTCPVWRLVHTRFQISNKELVIMSMKDISVQLESRENKVRELDHGLLLEFKYIRKKNLKIKRIHCMRR